MPTALVTGGAKRIGKAICEDLAANGFDVAIHYSGSAEDAEGLAEELTLHGVRAASFAADLTSTTEAQSLFAAALDAFGPIDLLVNNASIFQDDAITDFDEALWDAHFAIHLKSPSILVKAMAAQETMREGLVVNIIDQRVKRLNPSFYSYTLSKSAIWTATQTMAQALAPNIRVNAIGPGPTLKNARQREEDFQAQRDGLLLKRTPALGEFGQTIRYFWNAKSVTGQIIMLDGGQHLAWETPDIAGIPE